jgi:aerobic-type carbon monoxide dehydrogenase small subunit (CoxS/CutS family)
VFDDQIQQDNVKSKQVIKFSVNEKPIELVIGQQVDAWHTLAFTLRETLGLTGTKVSCDEGSCGACTVIMDGKAILACTTLTMDYVGRSITTVEGLSKGEQLHPIQKAFVEKSAFECGICTPGFIMSAKALLDRNPHPTKEEVKRALSGNLCRCGTYPNVVEAVLRAAELSAEVTQNV